MLNCSLCKSRLYLLIIAFSSLTIEFKVLKPLSQSFCEGAGGHPLTLDHLDGTKQATNMAPTRTSIMTEVTV